MSKKEDLEKQKKLERLKQRAGVLQARAVNKDNQNRDAELEQQTANRYEKVGVSPIYANGTFSSNSKKQVERNGSRLTEDDEVPSKNKKKNKQQY